MPFIHNSTATTLTAPVQRDTAQDLAELAAVAMSRPVDDATQVEQAAKVDENGDEYGSSRPPSPPSTGTTTPVLRIAPCPLRLWPFVPPPQYGVVEDYTIFRSSYPHDRHMDFIKSLEIKSILTLVETDPPPGYLQWMDEYQIKQAKISVAPNKEAKEGKSASATSLESICEALLFVMNASNHPMWIHCNQGRHRTGCVVACLRKVQGMPIDEVLKEYITYASPKARPGDIALIKSFDPNIVFAYAEKTGFIGGPDPKFKHAGPDPISNVYELAHALALAGRQDSVTQDETTDTVDNISSTMSDVSLGDGADLDQEVVPLQVPSSPAPIIRGESTDAIDPRLLTSSGSTQDDMEVSASVVEVARDETDNVDRMVLGGELDPMLDHVTVVTALS